jgi:hypothetical protein
MPVPLSSGKSCSRVRIGIWLIPNWVLAAIEMPQKPPSLECLGEKTSINSFSDILETQLTINDDCVKQRAWKEARSKHKRHKNPPDNIIFALWSGVVALISHRFVHFRELAAATLITRYRQYSNILSQERIRKRRRMDHYVTYSKSYYTVGVITGGNPYTLSLSLARARPAINCRLFAAPGDSAQTLPKLAPHKGATDAAARLTHKHPNVTASLTLYFQFIADDLFY